MKISILGRIGYDLYSEEPHTPLSQVRHFSRYVGGSSANMAVGLSRLGLDVSIIASLGTDQLSDYLLDFLNQERVNTTHVTRVPDYLPSLCLTEVSPPDRFPQVFYRRDPVDTRVDLTEKQLDALDSAHMFVTNGTSLCASPSRESTYLAMERARAAGCRVVLDIDYRPMSWQGPREAGLAVRLAMPFVDVLIGNDLELKLVANTDNLDDAIEKLRQREVPMLVSKLGDKGTQVWREDQFVFLEPYRVKVASTIGAGDGFAAGFLYALAHEKTVLECLHYGNAAAAIVVSRLSCSEAMPTLVEIEQLIAEQRAPSQ